MVDLHPHGSLLDETFAYDEGEGDRSLKYWRETHWDFFVGELASFGVEASPEMLVVCERFELVFAPELGPLDP
jgi:uncharacterized protein YhfF